MATLARLHVTQLPRMPLLYIMEYLQPHEALAAGEIEHRLVICLVKRKQ
jgi:hypothetical protein